MPRTGASTLLFQQRWMVAIWMVSLLAGCGGPSPTDGSEVPKVTPTRPADQVPLGVELTEDGLIRLHVPRCPSSQVTEVGWAYFPTLNTLWAIDREEDGPAIYEFTVGVAPPGFSTYVDLAGRVDEVPDDVPLSFIVTRSTDAGEALPAATASVQLDELSAGSIRYRLRATTPSEAASVDAFQAAVGC